MELLILGILMLIIGLLLLTPVWLSFYFDRFSERISELHYEFLQHAISTGSVLTGSHDYPAYKYLTYIFDSIEARLEEMSWIDLYFWSKKRTCRLEVYSLEEKQANQCFANAHSRSFLSIYIALINELRNYMFYRIPPFMLRKQIIHIFDLDGYLSEVMFAKAAFGKGAALMQYMARRKTISQVGAVIRDWQVGLLRTASDLPHNKSNW